MDRYWKNAGARWKNVPGNGNRLALVLPNGDVVSWGDDYPEGPPQPDLNVKTK